MDKKLVTLGFYIFFASISLSTVISIIILYDFQDPLNVEHSPLSAVDRENFLPQVIRSESVDIPPATTYSTLQALEMGKFYCISWKGEHDNMEIRVGGAVSSGSREGDLVWQATSTQIEIFIEDYADFFFFYNTVEFQILESEVNNLPDGYYGEWANPLKYDKNDGRKMDSPIIPNGSNFTINAQNPQLYVYGYISFRYNDPYIMGFKIMVVNGITDDVVFYKQFLLGSSYVEEVYALRAISLTSGTYRIYIEDSSRFTVKAFVKISKGGNWVIIIGIIGGIIGIPFLLYKMSQQKKNPSIS